MEADGSFRLFLSQVCPTEESGLYTLRARVMSIGGLNAAAMIAKDYGGPDGCGYSHHEYVDADYYSKYQVRGRVLSHRFLGGFEWR
jgi:hypothetical protein